MLKDAQGLDIREEVVSTGDVLIKYNRYQEGLDVLYDIKGQLEQLNIIDDVIFGQISESISKGEIKKGDLSKAKSILNESIAMLEKNVTHDNADLYNILARNYTQLGNVHSLEKDSNDFLQQYEKAKDIYEMFEELVPE